MINPAAQHSASEVATCICRAATRSLASETFWLSSAFEVSEAVAVALASLPEGGNKEKIEGMNRFSMWLLNLQREYVRWRMVEDGGGTISLVIDIIDIFGGLFSFPVLTPCRKTQRKTGQGHPGTKIIQKVSTQKMLHAKMKLRQVLQLFGQRSLRCLCFLEPGFNSRLRILATASIRPVTTRKAMQSHAKPTRALHVLHQIPFEGLRIHAWNLQYVQYISQP